MKNTLNIAFLNICSLRHKLYDVWQLLLQHDLDTLGVGETWLSDKVPSGVVNIPGDTIHRLDRQGQLDQQVLFQC